MRVLLSITFLLLPLHDPSFHSANLFRCIEYDSTAAQSVAVRIFFNFGFLVFFYKNVSHFVTETFRVLTAFEKDLVNTTLTSKMAPSISWVSAYTVAK